MEIDAQYARHDICQRDRSAKGKKSIGILYDSALYTRRMNLPTLVSLAADISGNILDVIRAQALAEGWHAVATRGDPVDHVGGLVPVVRLEGIWEEGLLSLDVVLAAGVAGGAVGAEDGAAVLGVSRGGGWGVCRHDGGSEAEGGTEGERAPAGAG